MNGLYEKFIDRVKEGCLYQEQGLVDWALEVFKEILRDLEKSELDEEEKERLRVQVTGYTEKLVLVTGPSESPLIVMESQAPPSSELPHCFTYGKALMDGQFWEEAIREFDQAVAIGFRVLECWELCGDCASYMENWEKANEYYRNVYLDPLVDDEFKRQILVKMTKCSQKLKKVEAIATFQARSEAGRLKEGLTYPEPLSPHPQRELATSTVDALDEHVIQQLVGECIWSWKPDGGEYVCRRKQSYRILNLLHVGMSSLVVELEDEETGMRCAGQGLASPFNRLVSPEALARWTLSQTMIHSEHVVSVFDLAHHENSFFIVRDHFPMSLAKLISEGEIMPISMAINFAHQILEGIGDLHLHMGRDEQIRNIYHLDLRPSRVLLHHERPVLKICNGGLWKTICDCSPDATAIRNLPLPFLPYRAPEQFRTYLARRRPPVFTDIFLFGVIFYEMLTGIPPFRASSFEESEIQHCEQYPIPPKAWRPQIPDEVNNLIMKCLETDPFKRWRSATEVSLLIEKCYNEEVKPVRDGRFADYLKP